MNLVQTSQDGGDPFCETLQRMVAAVFIMSDVNGDMSETVSAGELSATFDWLSQDPENEELLPIESAVIWVMQPLGSIVDEFGGAEAIISMVDADGSGEVDEEELMWAVGSLCGGDYYYGDYDYWVYYSDWYEYPDYPDYPYTPYYYWSEEEEEQGP